MITQPFDTGMPTKVMTYLSWKTFFKNMLKESVEN